MGIQPAERGTAAPKTPVAIENPVINSPFVAPTRHFTVVDGQVAGDIEEGGLGRWTFLEVTHMENAADLVRARFPHSTLVVA